MPPHPFTWEAAHDPSQDGGDTHAVRQPTAPISGPARGKPQEAAHFLNYVDEPDAGRQLRTHVRHTPLRNLEP